MTPPDYSDDFEEIHESGHPSDGAGGAASSICAPPSPAPDATVSTTPAITYAVRRAALAAWSGCGAAWAAASWRPFAPLPVHRRGWSQAYHDKLVAMIDDEEEKLLDHLGGIIHDLRRRVRVRKAGIET